MQIIIPGDPIPKARHRSFIRNGHVATYDSQSAQMQAFRYLLTSEVLKENYKPEEWPIKVDLIFQLDAFRGAAIHESNMRMWGYRYPACKKPDLDNLEKFLLDCGNGILWPDDRYIVQLSSKKEYSKNPCTIITIEMISEIKMSNEHENVFKTFSPDDLRNFSTDCDLLSNSIAQFNEPHGLEMASEKLAPSADILINFASKWVDKLKKIKPKV